MKDPTRLLVTSASELELRLLRAGAEEQPPSAAMQRLADKLGVNGAVSTLQPTAAGKLSMLPIGMAALGITLAGVVWVATHSTQLPAASEPQPQARPVAAEVSAPQATPDHSTPSLAIEIARIDAIRHALDSEHAKSAIAAVHDYQRDFPQGVLRQEAEVLSIQAHSRTGDRRGTRVLASRFLAEHPESPHSARVRELLNALGPDAR